MKFLADENIAFSVITALKRRGFDVERVEDYDLRGAKDVRLAIIEKFGARIITK